MGGLGWPLPPGYAAERSEGTLCLGISTTSCRGLGDLVNCVGWFTFTWISFPLPFLSFCFI